jgi:transposase
MRFITPLAETSVLLLQKFEKYSKKYQVRQRAKCLLLSNEGYEVSELCDIFKVHYNTMFNWFDAFEQQKLVGLYNKKGQGRKPILTKIEKIIVEGLTEQYPRNLNAVKSIVETEFKKIVSKKTLQRALKELDFTFRRVRRSLRDQQDPVKYAEKKAELEMLKSLELENRIKLYYMDESGFSLTPNIPSAWQKKGKPIELHSERKGQINVLGFYNKHNDLHPYTCKSSINSAFVIACIDDFAQQCKEPTVIVIDNAPTHTSKEFLAKIDTWQKMGVGIFNLPTYSPHLNIIEILWRKIKYEWLDFKAYLSVDNLAKELDFVLKNVGYKFTINFV